MKFNDINVYFKYKNTAKRLVFPMGYVRTTLRSLLLSDDHQIDTIGTINHKDLFYGKNAVAAFFVFIDIVSEALVPYSKVKSKYFNALLNNTAFTINVVNECQQFTISEDLLDKTAMIAYIRELVELIKQDANNVLA